jgi:pimeloyl-ACP methyl ester carboxylesterase
MHVSIHGSGQGSGHAILFLHGIPTSSALWNGVVEQVSNRFQCIAVDLPGLGKTPATREGFRNLPALADMLDEVRIEHKIRKWHIVGHDAGCALAVHYAHRFPDRVALLALLSPSMFPDLKPFYLFELLRKPVLGELLAPAVNLLFWRVAMRLATGQNRTVSDFEAPFRGPRGSWRLMSLLRWGHPADVLAAIPSLLPGILTPTLIFHGSKDPAVPEAFARRASNLMPNSELILLNSGHFLPITEPEAVAKELAAFFSNNRSLVAAGDPARTDTLDATFRA